VVYAQGAQLAEAGAVIMPETAFRAGGNPGLKAEYFASPTVTGTPVAIRQDRRIDFNYTRAAPLPGLNPTGFAVRWSGEFTPPGAGDYELAIDIPACWKDCTTHDAVRLWVDGKLLHDGPLGKARVTVKVASDGRAVPFRMEIDHRSEDGGVRLMWQPPAEPMLAQALAAAKDADTIVAVLGLSPDLEGEALSVSIPGFVGGDRTDIALPRPQLELLKALRKTGKPLVLVLTSGSAVAVDPSLADAILEAWYPGEEGGTAIAETLAGKNNPSGRLPVTFYASVDDLPAFVDYGMKERTYRFFTGKPLWGFGHGLSYTRFAYGEVAVKAAGIGQPVRVSAKLTNAGNRSGEEVAQVYVVTPDAGKPGGFTTPVLQRQLAGFQRASLAPGKSASLTFTLDPRSLSSVARDGTRRVMPGTYRVWIGGGQPGDGNGGWAEFALNGDAQVLPK
jgi:beta-glucosidase